MDNPITTQLEIPLIPYTDVGHAAAAYGKVWYAKYKVLVISIWVGLLLLLITYAALVGFTETFAWVAIGSLGGYSFILVTIIQSNGKVYFLRSVAKQWGWQYLPTESMKEWQCSLLRVGHSHTLGGVLKGTMQNLHALIGTFTYTIGSGKSATTYVHTLAKIDVGIVLPHVLFAIQREVLDNHIASKTNLVEVNIEQLAGDRRSLYVEPKLEIEALQVFSPKVMSEIELSWPQYSFELVGNELYVYGPRALTSRVDLQELFGLVEYIIVKLVPVLSRIQGSVRAMHEVRQKA